MRQREKQSKIEWAKYKIRSSKERKLDRDIAEYEFRHNQANRQVIKKMMYRKGQEKLIAVKEIRTRVKQWISIGYVTEICRLLAKRFKFYKDKLARIELEDKSARIIQGFVLKDLHEKSLT